MDDGVRSVLGVNRGKALERVEADDRPRDVVRLVDRAQALEDREIAPPAHAELHDDAVHRQRRLVDLVQEHQPLQGSWRREEGGVLAEIVVRNRRRSHLLRQQALRILNSAGNDVVHDCLSILGICVRGALHARTFV